MARVSVQALRPTNGKLLFSSCVAVPSSLVSLSGLGRNSGHRRPRPRAAATSYVFTAARIHAGEHCLDVSGRVRGLRTGPRVPASAPYLMRDWPSLFRRVLHTTFGILIRSRHPLPSLPWRVGGCRAPHTPWIIVSARVERPADSAARRAPFTRRPVVLDQFYRVGEKSHGSDSR